MEEQQPWHRLFALTWTDFFTGQPVTVEMEKDLSLKRQLLDVLLIHKKAEMLSCRLPDGFEELAAFNLVTFKSHAEKLSVWTLYELLGHYVNLRKQVSPAMDEDKLLPEEQFRLYAVCARFPQQLASRLGPVLRSLRTGVYEATALALPIRIVVANQLPEEQHNALLHLFSTRTELLAYGSRNYQIHSQETSTLLLELLRKIKEEIGAMSGVLEEFARETINRWKKEMSVEERMKFLGLTPEELLQGLSPEQRVKGLSAAQLRELADKKENGAAGESHSPASK